MAKFHLDRVRGKYNFTGEKYRKLMERVIASNTENIGRAVTRISNQNYEKAAKRIPKKKGKKLIMPDVSEVLPKRSVYFRKAAEQGNKISDTLRDRLTADLRATLIEFRTKTGKPAYTRQAGALAGTTNPEAIKLLESKLVETFQSYTKKDPDTGVPGNVRTIAVTELRSTIDDIKYQYAQKFQEKNPDIKMKKRWRHNGRLVEEPRPGHKKANGMTIDFNDNFVLDKYKKIKGKWVKIGVVSMRHPHDPAASADDVIGCQCDYEILMERGA